MRITKVGHADTSWLFWRPWYLGRRNLLPLRLVHVLNSVPEAYPKKLPLLNALVELLEVRVGQDVSILKHQDGLDHS